MAENEKLQDNGLPAEEAAQEKEHYVPRPKYQIVLAWIGVIVMLICVALSYYWIAHKY